MTVLILNPNTNADTTRRMVEIARKPGTGLVFEGCTAPDGVPMILDPQALVAAGRTVVEMARQSSLDPQVQGIVVAAFGDPGLDETRAELSVPVCGIGEAAFTEASAGGRRFAVATTTPKLVGWIDERVRACGHGGHFCGTFVTDEDPEALAARPAKQADALTRLCEHVAARRDNIGAIVIGGGPLAEAAAIVRRRVAVPIVEPVPAAARLMKVLLSRQGARSSDQR